MTDRAYSEEELQRAREESRRIGIAEAMQIADKLLGKAVSDVKAEVMFATHAAGRHLTDVDRETKIRALCDAARRVLLLSHEAATGIKAVPLAHIVRLNEALGKLEGWGDPERADAYLGDPL